MSNSLISERFIHGLVQSSRITTTITTIPRPHWPKTSKVLAPSPCRASLFHGWMGHGCHWPHPPSTSNQSPQIAKIPTVHPQLHLKMLLFSLPQPWLSAYSPGHHPSHTHVSRSPSRSHRHQRLWLAMGWTPQGRTGEVTLSKQPW